LLLQSNVFIISYLFVPKQEIWIKLIWFGKNMHWLDILMDKDATGGGLLTFILFFPFLIIFSFSLWCYFMAVECITYFWPRENTNLLTVYSVDFQVITLILIPVWSTATGTATSKRTTYQYPSLNLLPIVGSPHLNRWKRGRHKVGRVDPLNSFVFYFLDFFIIMRLFWLLDLF